MYGSPFYHGGGKIHLYCGVVRGGQLHFFAGALVCTAHFPCCPPKQIKSGLMTFDNFGFWVDAKWFLTSERRLSKPHTKENLNLPGRDAEYELVDGYGYIANDSLVLKKYDISLSYHL